MFRPSVSSLHLLTLDMTSIEWPSTLSELKATCSSELLNLLSTDDPNWSTKPTETVQTHILLEKRTGSCYKMITLSFTSKWEKERIFSISIPLERPLILVGGISFADMLLRFPIVVGNLYFREKKIIWKNIFQFASALKLCSFLKRIFYKNNDFSIILCSDCFRIIFFQKMEFLKNQNFFTVHKLFFKRIQNIILKVKSK
jgi:hypothetical protein